MSPAGAELMIEAQGLCKYYGQFAAIENVTFSIPAGQVTAFLGPNGAGKSTTIGVLSSLVRKTSGHVSIFGMDIDTRFAEAKQKVGIVPQEFNFNQFEKVGDILRTQAGYFGIPARVASARAEKYLHALGLWDKRNDASRMLSGGMKRRLMIARAMVHEPGLLILDEPTAGVDIELRRSLWDFLREINAQGTTIILTTHYLEEAEHLCRTIAIIDKGRIIENTTMKGLLAKLDRETFILDVSAPLAAVPALPGYEVRRVDDSTLEVDVCKTQPLNRLFEALSAAGISVVSLRNKANRLEETFVNLLAKSS